MYLLLNFFLKYCTIYALISAFLFVWLFFHLFNIKFRLIFSFSIEITWLKYTSNFTWLSAWTIGMNLLHLSRYAAESKRKHVLRRFNSLPRSVTWLRVLSIPVFLRNAHRCAAISYRSSTTLYRYYAPQFHIWNPVVIESSRGFDSLCAHKFITTSF